MNNNSFFFAECVRYLPQVNDSKSSFEEGKKYTHLTNDSITLTCNEGFEWKMKEKEQKTVCTADGWRPEPSHMELCHRGESFY